MNTRFLRALWLLLPAMLLAAAVSAKAPEGLIFTSILPQKYIVQRIAGPDFDVEALVGPGQSPATYEPGPRQMSRLTEARAIFPIGVPFESAWLPKIRASMKNLIVVETLAGTADGEVLHVHGEGIDPHVWTSPTEVIEMLPVIRDALSELAPAKSADFAERTRLLKRDLLELDREIRELYAGREARRFVVFHPAWGHFAECYGLEQVAIEAEGKEPGARSLALSIEKVKQLGIETIFVQQQFSRDGAEAVARAAGANLRVLDPLAEDYIDNLRRTALEIAEALR